MSSSVDARRFKKFDPIGYLGMTGGFKRHVEGSDRHTQRKLVEYCLSSFTTKGCSTYRCSLCHDLPVETSDEWGYLRDALLSDISQRKLVDDPSLDVLPVIKARGVTIRHSTKVEKVSPSAVPIVQASTAPLISPVEIPAGVERCVQSTKPTLPVTHIDTDDIPTDSTLPTLLTGDSTGGDVVEPSAKHTSTALVRTIACTVNDMDKVDSIGNLDKVISCAPIVLD